MQGLPRTANVLLVDPDRITYMVVRQALSRAPWLQLEQAETAEDAIEFMARHRVNLIVSDTELPDLNGIAFQRRVSARGGAPAHIFLTADHRKETRIKALTEGAADYLLKPCDPDELRLRCISALSRGHRDRATDMPRSILEGTLETLSLPDLLSVFSMAHASGMLTLFLGMETATLFLDKGQPISAAIGARVGLDAMYYLLALPPVGTFSLSKSASGITRNIHAGMMEILMEAARLHDERALTTKSPMVRRISSTGGGVHQRGERVFAPIPTPTLARRVTDQLADPFTFGELHLLTSGPLAAWSRRKQAGTRIDVWLVADIATGARSMLEIASPVSELLLVTAMGGAGKILALMFSLRDDLEVNVLLLDPRSAASFAGELARTPAFAIVAQPTSEGPGGVPVPSPSTSALDASGDPTASAYLGVSQLLAAHSLDLLLISKQLIAPIDWQARTLETVRPPRVVPIFVGEELDLRAQLLQGLTTWGNLLNEIRPS
jgi:CheY-like chemotaxis protein